MPGRFMIAGKSKQDSDQNQTEIRLRFGIFTAKYRKTERSAFGTLY